ncbi:MAG: hypothetical protein IJ202_00215 [Bacteroidales bacterium]|nr:hypothetical protein [Bacteroidales bacterium]
MKQFIIILLSILSASLPLTAQSLEELLQQLDETISQADKYVSEKEVRIKTIENPLRSRGISAEQRYSIYKQLYEEYMTYNFAKASEALEGQEAAARELGDRNLINEVLISRAMVNATGGMYLEASNILQSQIDTTILSDEQKLRYWEAQQRFWYDYRDYLRGEDPDGRMASKIAWYRNAILSTAPENSVLYQGIAVRQAMENQNWGQADFLCKNLIAKLSPDSHEYANWTYYEARICEQLDRREEMNSYFIRSAIADLKTATKDNASLCSLSQELFLSGELQRAFRYISTSLDDARFYDAWLRQWQIAEVFPDIQRGYEDFRSQQDRRNKILMTVISVLGLLTLAAAFWTFHAYRRQRRLNVKIRQMNSQIQEFSASLQQVNEALTRTNSELVEANAAKEEYIGMFVSLSSDYIEKTKKYQSSVRKMVVNGQYDEILAEISSKKLLDEELSLFYQLFDQAFLKLYPNFVEQFNALLRPEERIQPKKDELLTTELRIFALIRLGITQSSQIASLLRYSVNTIYNYRAQIKRGAIGEKEEFEDKVRLLGA